MEKTGKISSVVKGKPWKDFEKYDIFFEGDKTKYQFMEAKGYVPSAGDTLTYRVSNEKYNTIMRVGDIPKGNPQPEKSQANVVRSQWDYKDRLIVLQTCIKAAAERHAQSSVDNETVIKTAKQLFNFIDQNR